VLRAFPQEGKKGHPSPLATGRGKENSKMRSKEIEKKKTLKRRRFNIGERVKRSARSFQGIKEGS